MLIPTSVNTLLGLQHKDLKNFCYKTWLVHIAAHKIENANKGNGHKNTRIPVILMVGLFKKKHVYNEEYYNDI